MTDIQAIIGGIKLHHQEHPDHGLDCACMDKYIAAARKLFIDIQSKDWRLQRRIDYVLRSALER